MPKYRAKRVGGRLLLQALHLRGPGRGPRTPPSRRATVADHREWPIGLNGEQLLLLLLGQLVDLGGEAVRRLLDLVVAPALLVLRDLLVLGEGLHLVVGLAPGAADRDPRVLRELAHRLGELLAPLLGQGRHGEPDDLAVVARAEA